MEEILKKGEDSYTEFKSYETLQDCAPDSLASEIIAFANTDGGNLYIGINDDCTISGINEPDKWMQKVDNICENNIEPPIRCQIEKIIINDKIILKVKIPKGSLRPYRAAGKIYIRVSSGKRVASREDIKYIFQSVGAFFSDENIISDTSIDDLDMDYVINFFNDHIKENIITDKKSDETFRILKNAKIMSQDGLTTAGLMFFTDNPQSFLPFAKISTAIFKGETIGTEMIKQDIEGRLEKQFSDISNFFKNNIPELVRIKGFEKENERKIPLEVLRECMVNAIVHRDYTLTSQIRVFIFDNRIEIKNPGKLLNTLSVESIKLGIHLDRNPIISSFMAKMGYMTQHGTGIPRILKLMEEHGFKEPEIISGNGEFQITLWMKK